MNDSDSNNSHCKNCSAILTGQTYCPDCGQRTDTHVLTFSELIGEVAGDLFNLDSRLWHTLIPLMIRPGYLTQEYLRGRRAYYLPPFRMYLVLSIVFFLLLSISRAVNGPYIGESDGPTRTDTVSSPVPEQARTEVSPGIDGAPDVPAEAADQERCQLSMLKQDSRLTLLSKYVCLQALDNSEKFGTTYRDAIPVMMLLGFPFVAAIMLVLYPFSGRLYAEHLTFFFHVHAFLFLTAILVQSFSLLVRYVDFLSGLLGWIQMALLLYVPVYLFLAMKRVYGQGILMTLTKFLVLGLGYLFLVTVALVAGLFYVAYTI